MSAKNVMLTTREAAAMLEAIGPGKDWRRFLKRDRLKQGGQVVIPFIRKSGLVFYRRDSIICYVAVVLSCGGLLELDMKTFRPGDWTIEDLLAHCKVRQEQRKSRAAAIVAWIWSLFGYERRQVARAV